MPNRKIKHIVAKLVGASTEETLDVYDVDAVHTDKIYNGLDQTTAGYVLDARQGKALNDSLLGTINSRCDFYGLIMNASVSTTSASKTLQYSRKFSGYRYLLFVMYDNGSPKHIRDTALVTREFFVYCTVMTLTQVDSSNTQHWIEVAMTSDTTANVYCNSSTAGWYVNVYGIYNIE